MRKQVCVKKKRYVRALLIVLLLFPLVDFAWGGGTEDGRVAVPILLYHRFGPVVADSMTIKTSVLASQLEYLHTHGYTVIPLRQLIASLAGKAPRLPDRSVVITADDGHESVFTDLFPLIRRYHMPITLFIYPSAISNASYSLTWSQLQEMKDSGFVDIQSHTYWHPNFKKEKKRLSAQEYENFVHRQLFKSREVLQQKLGGTVDMLAWPFGIYDDELINDARQAGYIVAFSMARHPVTRSDSMMALPRYLMINPVQGIVFEKLLAESSLSREKRENHP
ncbi:MAG: polysaccharide deacetylase family protein [Ferrovum myxofaciens]|uniref:Polysaccharide deacetylase family protein n=1 Tax=Ferrovum myxofaciens TaxID=416213 RepID=A0A9E6SY27_9PROT|nr:MAG: polysaccharide deacetylase family protein [Ferrovum myxofaciens]QWY75255.1 MAG: polysaccharide deacetylase family protein [Ferrovum myxofaciens]QWY77994.1 MAG: polysaccharide deacetylase family protein [Ferrovum myxofaciens]